LFKNRKDAIIKEWDVGKRGDVLKLLEQAYPPKKPDIYRKGDNDFMHLFRFRKTDAFPN
jgi:hypothetical protein